MVDPFPRDRSRAYTVSASAAFERIVQRESLRGSSVLLPAFICSDGFEPIFEQYDVDPVFVDVDRMTYHIDFDRAADHLSEVDAVLLVHAFGLPAPVDRWAERCRRTDVLLIEDCARALGARYNGRTVGAFGDYAIFSLRKVSPVFTGGCLVAASDEDGFELGPPTLNADVLVKTAYNALPRGISYEEELVDLYQTVMGDRMYSIEDTESNLSYGSATSDEHDSTVRELDPLTRYLFERYLRRTYPRARVEQEYIATELRQLLQTHEFDVQPSAPGRVQYTLPATVPGERDELVAYLRSRGHPVGMLWDDPWGLTHSDTRSDRDYPVTAHLADHVVTVPIRELSQSDVGQLEGDLRHFYRSRRPIKA